MPARRTETDEERENEVTTTADLLGNQEIEVDPITPMAPEGPGSDGMVEVRMNTTLEDFTFGDPHVHHRLEHGKRYRMPLHIAVYLDSLGYIWH